MDRRTCFSLGTDRIQRIGASLIVLQYLVLLALNVNWLVGLALVLVLDAIMRWSLSHGGFQAGLGEWLVRRGG